MDLSIKYLEMDLKDLLELILGEDRQVKKESKVTEENRVKEDHKVFRVPL